MPVRNLGYTLLCPLSALANLPKLYRHLCAENTVHRSDQPRPALAYYYLVSQFLGGVRTAQMQQAHQLQAQQMQAQQLQAQQLQVKLTFLSSKLTSLSSKLTFLSSKNVSLELRNVSVSMRLLRGRAIPSATPSARRLR